MLDGFLFFFRFFSNRYMIEQKNPRLNCRCLCEKKSRSRSRSRFSRRNNTYIAIASVLALALCMTDWIDFIHISFGGVISDQVSKQR